MFARALVVVLLMSGPALAQESYGVYGADRFFKLEWSAGERKGHPVVSGYIFNDYGFAARDVRLRVEALDASGKVVATTIGSVPFIVTPGTRAPFEVPVPQRAASYRVTVLSFDWIVEPRRDRRF
jgi:hypothetical protein